MLRWLTAIAMAMASMIAVSAQAASTINSGVPLENSPDISGPVRQNFSNAAADVNNILGCFAGPTLPASPSAFQLWCNIGAAPVIVVNQFDGISWVPVWSFNASTHVASIGSIADIPLGSMATQNAGAGAITGGTITALGLPSSPSDAATKQYVDASVVGQVVHAPVAWATAAVLPNTPTYSNGSYGVGATPTALVVDGGTPPLGGDRVLVKNRASGFQNGTYVVTTAGSGSVPWVLTRATDFNTAASGNIATDAYFFVSGGSTNVGSEYLQTTSGTITIGTTNLAFAQFSSATNYGAGTGISIGGGVIGLAQIAADTTLCNPTGGLTSVAACTTTQLEGILNFTQPGTGAVQQTVDAKIKRGPIDPVEYGAVCDGVTHDDTALQNTINAAAAGSLPIHFTSLCAAASTLTYSGPGTLVMQGSGRNVSGIVGVSNTGDIINKTGAGDLIMRDMQVSTTVARTSGAAVHLQGSGSADLIENCFIFGTVSTPLYVGIQDDTELLAQIHYNYILNASIVGIYLRSANLSAGGESAVHDNTIDINTSFHGGGSVGVLWASGAGTAMFVANRIQNVDYCYLIQPEFNIKTAAFNINGGQCAANTVGGVVVSQPGGNTTTIQTVAINNVDFDENSAGSPVVVYGTTSNFLSMLTMIGGSVTYSSANAVNLGAGSSALIDDVNFTSVGGNIAAISLAASLPLQLTLGVNQFNGTNAPYSFNGNTGAIGRALNGTGSIALANGFNEDIAAPLNEYTRITGPTAAFDIGGVANGFLDGEQRVFFNTTSQQLTIVNEDGSSSAGNRITTLTGTSVTLRSGTSSFTLRRDQTSNRWILVSTN